MAAGECGAPGNGGNGVRHGEGTAKKFERSVLPNFPCLLRKGRGHGVAAGVRAVPEDASEPGGDGNHRTIPGGQACLGTGQVALPSGQGTESS